MSKALFGGLLSGLGTGIVSQGERMRQEALERAKLLQRTQERAEDRQWRQEDLATTQGFQAKQAEEQRAWQESRDKESARIQAERDKRQADYQAERDKVLAGYKAEEEKAKTEKERKGLLTDKQTIEMVALKHTTTGADGQDQIDWNAVADDLAKNNREDLANLARVNGNTKGRDDLAWSEANSRADKWVENQASIWNSDKTDFADYGGNREEARQAKAMEYYNQLTNLGGGDGDTEKRVTQPQVQPSNAAASGSLVRDDSGKVTGSKSMTYKSREDVGEAVRKGKLTREEAIRILKEQFGASD